MAPGRTPTLPILGSLLLAAAGLQGAPAGREARTAPDFPTRDPELWINSPPLRMADLRGSVVLIEVWTYG